jgi:hypothetical protein
LKGRSDPNISLELGLIDGLPKRNVEKSEPLLASGGFDSDSKTEAICISTNI